MPVINRILNGKLNLDASNYAVPPRDFIDALNITRDSKGEAQDRIVTNLNGNTLVNYSLPAGTNKVIGSYEDKVRNRVYYFIWNSNGYNRWVYFNMNDGTITTIIEDLTDTGAVAVLAFNPSKKINHIDVIYRDDDGDLHFWTDGNTTPKCANVSRIINGDYSVVKSNFIETAKRPPLNPITATYGSDSTRNANSIKKNLFQFTYRYVYDDFQKSTFATYSKVALPIGFYGSDNDNDPSKNNFITLNYTSGDENVAKVELAMRYNIGGNWSDFVQIAVLDKTQIGIGDNVPATFVFYNDGIFPPIDVNDLIRLFDYVPQLAYSQVLADGKNIVYGNITEGYNQFPQGSLDVDISVANVTNNPPDVSPPSITYNNYYSGFFQFNVNGGIPVGTVFEIYLDVPPNPGPTNGSHQLVSSYTSISGDTIATVAQALYNSTSSFYRTGYVPGNNFYTVTYPDLTVVSEIRVISGSGGGGSSISTEKTWLWNCNYIFGLVYVDEQNRDMPGVTTYYTSTDTTKDFSVTTPNFSLSGAAVQTPVISASINHLPPAGAVKYYWVRRRLGIGSFVQYITCDFQSDTDYYYFCLANIDRFKLRNSQFNYATAPITQNSRIMILGGETSGGYDGKIWTQDYQVLGKVTRTMTSGSSPADDFEYIKVKIPASAPSPTYEANMLVMVYEPAANPVSAEDAVYYEFGEAYDIYQISGINYHRGKGQDQTASQPAVSVWEEGDVYFHKRSIYTQINGAGESVSVFLNMMDANFSDYFLSAVNDNGRAQVIEPDAKKQRNGVFVRNGHAYQASTTINETNRFDFLDFDEYDASKGDIMKMYLDKKRIVFFFKFDVGVVPIYTQVIQDTSGNPLQANSNTLLNKIAYPYIGKFGIGDTPESFAYGKSAMYFADSNKGVICRLSQDGITPISVLYECNAFFVSKLAGYGKNQDDGSVPPGGVYAGNPTVYGAFDSYTNKYIIALEQIDRYVFFNYSSVIVAPDRLLRFTGSTPVGFKITLNISASNGNTQSVSYTAVSGDTITTVRNQLSNLINAGSLFVATAGTYTTFDGFPVGGAGYPGLLVHNVSSSSVSIGVVVENLTYFHQDPYTITFNETRDSMEGFESFNSYHPENMVSLNNLFITFLSGQFWRHDSTVYNNFYGVQYEANIEIVFNDNINVKKTFDRIAYQSNRIWVSTTDGDIATSDTNPMTGLEQISKLRDFDYLIDENVKYAAFLRDINSNAVALEGLYNGDHLKGTWVSVKLRYGGNLYAYVFSPHVGFAISFKNT